MNKLGQSIEVYEYEVRKGKTGAQHAAGCICTVLTLGLAAPLWAYDELESFWIYFYNNKLVQWGKAGDWKKEADHISEIRFT